MHPRKPAARTASDRYSGPICRRSTRNLDRFFARLTEGHHHVEGCREGSQPRPHQSAKRVCSRKRLNTNTCPAQVTHPAHIQWRQGFQNGLATPLHPRCLARLACVWVKDATSARRSGNHLHGARTRRTRPLQTHAITRATSIIAIAHSRHSSAQISASVSASNKPGFKRRTSHRRLRSRTSVT